MVIIMVILVIILLLSFRGSRWFRVSSTNSRSQRLLRIRQLSCLYVLQHMPLGRLTVYHLEFGSTRKEGMECESRDCSGTTVTDPFLHSFYSRITLSTLPMGVLWNGENPCPKNPRRPPIDRSGGLCFGEGD